MTTSPIRKAVFPVAGLGSRFLPATKAQPKEMLPIVDKPLIQYAVEEAVASGITELIFVTGRNKRAIEDHFDTAYELEDTLQNNNKTELLALVQDIIPSNVNCVFIRQPKPLGLGHAVLCAKSLVGNDPFVVMLADDFMMTDPGTTPVLKQMIDAYQQEWISQIAVQTVPWETTKQYGIVTTSRTPGQMDLIVPGTSIPMIGIVEKPQPNDAPSNLAVVGRYVFNNAIMGFLEKLPLPVTGEVQLTDAISAMMRLHQVEAFNYVGKRFDCGSKLGYLEATVEMGMRHPELGAAFIKYLKGLTV
jgi:UTP--glucose-1-phosphate uridylyltransferase